MNKEVTIAQLLSSKEELEPETVYKLFPELSPKEVEKLMVIRVILHTNFVHKDFDVFENACYVLNDLPPDVNKTEGVNAKLLWKAIDIINSIRKAEFSTEVKEYVKFCLKEEGIYFLPPGMFYVEENPLLEKVTKLASNGPFPLEENFMGIQAVKYLKLQGDK